MRAEFKIDGRRIVFFVCLSCIWFFDGKYHKAHSTRVHVHLCSCDPIAITFIDECRSPSQIPFFFLRVHFAWAHLVWNRWWRATINDCYFHPFVPPALIAWTTKHLYIEKSVLCVCAKGNYRSMHSISIFFFAFSSFFRLRSPCEPSDRHLEDPKNCTKCENHRKRCTQRDQYIYDRFLFREHNNRK